MIVLLIKEDGLVFQSMEMAEGKWSLMLSGLQWRKPQSMIRIKENRVRTKAMRRWSSCVVMLREYAVVYLLVPNCETHKFG